jgi:FdhE protein
VTTLLSWPTFTDRRRRAAELAERWPFAAEVLRLYAAVIGVQERAASEALDDPPASLAHVPAWVAEHVMPQLIHATVAAGPEPLATTAQAMLYGRDLAQPVARWLWGGRQPPAETFLARAATMPVLEVAPGLLVAPTQPSARHCPRCGAPPQVSFFGLSDDALVTAPRYLRCSRCMTSWTYPRMVCAGCGEEAAGRLPILADHDVFPHLRVDACETCHAYLINVDLPKDPAAVPIVDELAALPLDLAAQDRGFRKITPNLVQM